MATDTGIKPAWQSIWKAAYKKDPQSILSFYYWLHVVKGLPVEQVKDFDFGNDKDFALLEEYGLDPEINRLAEECQEEMGWNE